MKKIVGLSLIACLALSMVFMATGCSSKSSAKKIKVLLYMQEHEKKIYEKIVADFAEEHKDEIAGIDFEITTQEEYNTKMIAAMTANDMPDVFYIGPESVRSYVDNGRALPLDSYVDASAVNNLWPAIIGAYRYDGNEVGKGSLYCLPKDLSCFAFAYNKDIFDAAGVGKMLTFDYFDDFIETLKSVRFVRIE